MIPSNWLFLFLLYLTSLFLRRYILISYYREKRRKIQEDLGVNLGWKKRRLGIGDMLINSIYISGKSGGEFPSKSLLRGCRSPPK